MALGGLIGAVDGAVAEPEIPGFRFVAAFTFQEIDGPIGVLVGGVAFEDFGFAALVGDGLVVVVVLAGFGVFRAIPDELVVPVAAEAGIGTGVPFADLGGEVAFLAEDFGPERAFFGVVFAARVGAFHAHGFDAVGVSAGEHGGAGGHAPGAVVGGKEADALFGEAVDVGCFDPGVGFFVATEGAVGVVVGVDEEDVGAFGGGGGLHGEGGGGGEGAEHLAAG